MPSFPRCRFNILSFLPSSRHTRYPGWMDCEIGTAGTRSAGVWIVALLSSASTDRNVEPIRADTSDQRMTLWPTKALTISTVKPIRFPFSVSYRARVFGVKVSCLAVGVSGGADQVACRPGGRGDGDPDRLAGYAGAWSAALLSGLLQHDCRSLPKARFALRAG